MTFEDKRFQIQDITTAGVFTALFHVLITAYQLNEIYFLSRVLFSQRRCRCSFRRSLVVSEKDISLSRTYTQTRV